MSRSLKNIDDETNSTIYRHRRRTLCGCSICGPHRGENKSRYGRHGRGKPRYKDHK